MLEAKILGALEAFQEDPSPRTFIQVQDILAKHGTEMINDPGFIEWVRLNKLGIYQVRGMLEWEAALNEKLYRDWLYGSTAGRDLEDGFSEEEKASPALPA